MTLTRYIGGFGGGYIGNRISVANTGITLPKEFHQAHPELKNKDRVSLYYDKEGRKIALKFHDSQSKGEELYGTLKITKPEMAAHWYISSKNFLKVANTKAGHYEYEVDDEGKFVLKDAIKPQV